MKYTKEFDLMRFLNKNVINSDRLFAEGLESADKLLLREVAREQAEDFMRVGASIAHYAYLQAVVKEMERRYGYNPAENFRIFDEG